MDNFMGIKLMLAGPVNAFPSQLTLRTRIRGSHAWNGHAVCKYLRLRRIFRTHAANLPASCDMSNCPPTRNIAQISDFHIPSPAKRQIRHFRLCTTYLQWNHSVNSWWWPVIMAHFLLKTLRIKSPVVVTSSPLSKFKREGLLLFFTTLSLNT